MMLPAKIRKLLNGGAAAAGVDGLRAAIDAIAAEIAAAKAELATLPTLRSEAALADDGEAQCTALTARETYLYSSIEVAEIRIAKLRDKLREQINYRRRDRIEHHRREAREKFEALTAALVAAVEANEAATAAYQAATAELGAGDAALLVTKVNYLPPGAVVRDMVAHWSAVTRREMEGAARALPTSPRPVPQGTPFRHDGNAKPLSLGQPNISHGDFCKGPTRLRQTPTAPQSKPATAAKALPPKPAVPLEPPPAPVLPKPDADGCISIHTKNRITIAGTAHAAGKTLRLPFDEAKAAVLTGRADFVDANAG